MYIAEVYDGISIWPNDTAGGDVSAVVRHLDNHQSCTGKGGDRYEYGTVRNMEVFNYESGRTEIRGSLAKYICGHSCDIVRLNDCSDALRNLSERMQNDLSSWNVGTLEFGATYQMKNRPQEYLNVLGYLGDVPPERCRSTTLYYNSSKFMQLRLYDKGAEAVAGGWIPDGFRGLNLLRYEWRAIGDIAAGVGWHESVKVATLTDTEFYKTCMNKYKTMYDKITKRADMPAGQKPTTVGQFDKQGINMLLVRYPEIYADIEQTLIGNGFADRREKSRYNRRKQEQMNAACRSGLEQELTEKIHAVQ